MNGFFAGCRNGSEAIAVRRFRSKNLSKISVLATFAAVFCFSKNSLFGQCTLVCDNLINVSLDQNGQATIAPDMIAQNPYNPASCSPTGPTFFEVSVMGANGQPIPTSPTVTCTNLNATLSVKVKHLPSGNSCWGSIHIEDKMAPTFNCLDKKVSCNLQNLLPTNPAVGQPTVVDNCDANVTLSFSDDFVDVPCGQLVNGMNVAAYITRSWSAVDDSGNASTCVQHIWLERKTIDDIVWPPYLDDVAAPALDCVNPNTSPANTGRPQIDGRPIDGYCELSYNFEDQNLPMCGAARKILRTWTVLDWCSNQISTHLQIIHVADKTPPSFGCPQNLTLATSPTNCFATANLPAVQVVDDCSPTTTVKITSPVGNIDGNGGTLQNVPIGSHTITYEAKDLCGNTSTCTFILKIEDQIAPNTVCRAALVVGLNNSGTANVVAQVFDNGSFDNCTAVGQLVFTARRLPDTIFTLKVKFDCSHVGVQQMVIVRVEDASGNFNECMTTVNVQDKMAPTITCPADLTLNCDVFAIGILNTFGTATAVDNCLTATVEELAPTISLSACNAGMVTRKFRATDAGGFSAICTQKITVVNNLAWNGLQNITWPADFSTSKCATTAAELAPDSLPAGSDFPKFTGQNACNSIAWTFDDQVFQIAPPACFKIFRKWKVVDWCRYNSNDPNGAGQWTHIQKITVMDGQAPVFQNPPANLTIGLGADCKATVELPQLVATDCSPNPTVTVSGTLGTGFGPFQNVAAGVYLANYKATDGCGNVATHLLKITVADVKPPTVICHNGLSANLMPTGMVQIWASDFDKGSTDNCTAAGDLKFSFSADTAQTGMVFNCQTVGTNVIDVWATDAAGNGSFCSTYVLIQDNSGFCSPPTATIAGQIRTPKQQNLSGVKMKIGGVNGLPNFTTDTTGNFAFPGLPVNVPYTLTPEKNDDWLNGITTYDLLQISRHILGVSEFDTPYKIIAADVNGSNSVTTNDIVILRKLILGITDTLPVGKSWRFVDASWQFDDPSNPFSKQFPEMKNFAPLQASGGLADFTAVKIGDVNGNAAPNFAPAGDDRNEKKPVAFLIENQKVTTGTKVSVPVRAADFDGIEGYQFLMFFDSVALQLDSISNFGLDNLSEANFAYYSDLGSIAANWENWSGDAQAADNQIFTLNFTAWKDGWLSDFLNLKNKSRFSKPFLETEAYRDGQVVPLLFQITGKQPVAVANLDFEISPNPVFERAKVQVSLPATARGEAQLSLFDLTGKKFFEKTLSAIFGSQSVEIQRDSFPSAGVFFCQLEMAGKVLTKKIAVF